VTAERPAPEPTAAPADDPTARMSADSAPSEAPASRSPASKSSASTSRGGAGGPETPPPGRGKRRRRDGTAVGYLSGVFTFLTLVVLALAGAFYWGKTTFDEPGPLAQETTVMIARNQGVSEIADSLARAGVIDHPRLFELGVRAYGVKDRLRYGEYAFPAGVSMREAMVIIASGKSIEHTVTIPEGLTSLQIVDRLRDQPLLTGDVKATPPEGSLLPETYKFMRGASREQMIARMQEHQKAVLEKVWAARTPSSAIKSPDDLVTLASLIEKETGVPEERERVAAVFANRLAKGMRLQSDPTIVYGLVGGRGTLGRSLNRADIASRTPYNTYVVSGLPAGPIANPGRASLEAAANPAKTNDLYFVADGSGGHAFAATLAEHNRNVAAWRKIERSRALPADRLAPDDAAPEAPADDAPTGAAPASSSSAPAKPKPSDRRRPDVR
jgi:UPF0755 protein